METIKEKWECPAVTIQRFTPQEFVAVCTYNVKITCPGQTSNSAQFFPLGSGGQFAMLTVPSFRLVSFKSGLLLIPVPVITPEPEQQHQVGCSHSLFTHSSHDIVVSGYTERVSSLSSSLLNRIGGTIYNKGTYTMMEYTLNGTTSESFGSDDYVLEDSSGYHLLLASNTQVISTPVGAS